MSPEEFPHQGRGTGNQRDDDQPGRVTADYMQRPECENEDHGEAAQQRHPTRVAAYQRSNQVGAAGLLPLGDARNDVRLDEARLQRGQQQQGIRGENVIAVLEVIRSPDQDQAHGEIRRRQ